jgi:hypothetical protein
LRLVGAGLAVDLGKGAQKLAGDEGQDRGATGGDFIFDDQIGDGGKEVVDLDGGVEFVGWAGKASGEVAILGVPPVVNWTAWRGQSPLASACRRQRLPERFSARQRVKPRGVARDGLATVSGDAFVCVCCCSILVLNSDAFVLG